jgi:fructosamine-3-kinase
MRQDQQIIRQILADELALDPDHCRFEPVHGGDIHSSMAVNVANANPARYFVKSNTQAMADVLAAEYQSLVEITRLFPACYPQPVLFRIHQGRAFLIMQFLQLTALSNRTSALAGQRLAEQHRIMHSRFGWSENNFIGSSQQINDWCDSWPEFFRDCRLTRQLDFAREKNLPNEQINAIEEICLHIHMWFTNYRPRPSLLHGDLWSGNIGHNLAESKPAFFDPAPYYGDRETDIAMTELFGRLPAEFYQQYNRTWQIDLGYTARRPLYNLYHALNHFVLFGRGYEGLVQSHTQALLRFLNQS